MSADNGVYIAKIPLVGGGAEYRVRHCQNIEELAVEYAWELYKKILEESGIVEYGVSSIEFDCPLPNWSRKEANKIIDKAWVLFQKERDIKDIIT